MKNLLILLIIPLFSIGQCVIGDCENGNGFYLYEDEISLYQGGFKNGIEHGWGTEIVYDENGYQFGVYDGEFINGQAYGWGTETVYDDDGTWLVSYTGNFKNGNWHGWGVAVWEEGQVEQGQFKNGDFIE
tara:strand:+ start:992 stop:1381 length:390 start_codon:yes stop_codon:yes gene_type:complete